MNYNDVLNTMSKIMSPAYREVASSIANTPFQNALRRSTKTIIAESKEIREAIEEMKPEKLKEAIKSANEKLEADLKAANGKVTEKLKAKIKAANEALEADFKAFTAQPDVQQLLAIESKIVLHTVKLSDLPTDLNGKQMDAVDWLLEE